MNEPFDPFGLDERDQDISFVSNASTSSNRSNVLKKNQDVSMLASFDTSLNGNSVPTSKNRSFNTSIDSDIFSQLFESDNRNSRRAKALDSANTSFSSSVSITPTKPNVNISNARTPELKADQATPTKLSVTMDKSNISNSKIPISKGQVTLPVYVTFHETMSCVYDDSNSSSLCEVEGAIDLVPNKFIQGQSFYIAIKDPKKHVGEITSYLDFAREISLNNNSKDQFVIDQLKNGCRVFQVDIPGSLVNFSAKPIHVLKVTGSEMLRPIPLVSAKNHSAI